MWSILGGEEEISELPAEKTPDKEDKQDEEEKGEQLTEDQQEVILVHVSVYI